MSGPESNKPSGGRRRAERLEKTRRNVEGLERRRIDRVEQKIRDGKPLTTDEAEVLLHSQSRQRQPVGRPNLSGQFHRWLAAHYLCLRARRRPSTTKIIARTWGVSEKAVEKYVKRHRDEPEVKALVAVMLDDPHSTDEKWKDGKPQDVMGIYARLFRDLDEESAPKAMN